MAMSKSPAFTTADRRKKKVTYGKSASLAATQNFKEDAPSPKRLRKQADGSHGSLERYGNKFGASNTLSSVRVTRQTPRNIFDDDDELTPRPSATPTKKGPPKDDEFDVFDVPSSGDKRSNTGCRRAKIAQPARKVDAAPPPVYTQKKRLQERGRVAEPSANDASVAPQAPQALPARRRAKTPQAVQMPLVESIGRRAVLSTAMATGHGPNQASHTRPAKRREPEHDPKQANHTRPAKRRELEHGLKQANYTRPAKRQEPEHDPNQASQAEPTIEMIKDWGSDELLQWIQQYRPKLLKGDNLEKFRAEEISGNAFMSIVDNVDLFKSISNLPPGIIMGLAILARDLAGGETVGRKRIGKQTENVEIVDAASRWEEFNNRARTLHDNGKEDIDTEESDDFPEDNDPKLDEACEALSKALQDASKAMEVNDNVKVKRAVHNLRKAYNDAAKSKTVTIRYIDAEPPPRPYSPLGGDIGRTLLAQPWMMELISRLRDKSFPNRLVVIGNPGIGKSVALVGYLLFYLIAQGQRVILQWETTNGSLGYVFDDNGVHEVFSRNALTYDDGKPCYLLVSADGLEVYPLNAFAFCDRIIVVTSPNLLSKEGLKDWIKQVKASQFIASRPSCHEVVYLLSRIWSFDRSIIYWMYREWTRDFRACESDCQGAISHLNKGTLSQWYREKQQHLSNLIEGMLSGDQGPDEAHQIHNTRTNMTIPSALVNMERSDERTDAYKTTFATRRIAQLVAKVQRRQRWKNNWESMTLFFNNPETRVAAGELFQKMFLWKFRKQHPNTMPKCYELRSNNGPHPESGSASAVPMPWDDLDQQPTLKWISVGKDADGSLYSKKELKNAINAVNLKPDDPQAIRFLIPCGQNWASWDAALFIGKHRTNRVDIHIVFLQLTVNRKHDILAKGLNQVRDAIGRKPTRARVHYHYILVLLTHDDDADRLNIPTWRPILNNSKERKQDASWKNLKEYIMFVPRAELVEGPLED